MPSTPEKIYVAGHRGMVGSAIVRQLVAAGCVSLAILCHSQNRTNQKIRNQDPWRQRSRKRGCKVFDLPISEIYMQRHLLTLLLKTQTESQAICNPTCHQ
jgi:nucleoside-diphosphate-sugar epimerase